MSIYKLPITFHDFGPCYMTDWEVDLFDYIFLSLCPNGTEMWGDELYVPNNDEDDDCEEIDIGELSNEAFEIFCGISGHAEILAAAEHYGVPLPEPGEPMYYEDSCSGDIIIDVNGNRVKNDDEDD